MLIKRAIGLIILSVILFSCCTFSVLACAEDMGSEGSRMSNRIPIHLLFDSDHGGGSVKEHIVVKPCDKLEKHKVRPKKICKPAEEENKCDKVDKKVAPPCKPEKPDEIKPEESCGTVEKKDENSESGENVVVSPEESGTGVSEGIVSHGRSENYDKVKIIPVSKLSSGINLTIEKPPRYVTGNLVELMAGTNLTWQQETVMGLEFKWKIDSKSFHLEYIVRNRTVYLPDGDYSVNLTAIENGGKETSVGKIVTVTRAGGGYAPECGRIERCKRENVGCDLWGGSCFLLCYEDFKFVGVSWVPREGIVGLERFGRPKQCFVGKALSRILGEGYRNKNDLKLDSFCSG